MNLSLMREKKALIVQQDIWTASGVRHLDAGVCAADVEELREEWQLRLLITGLD